MGEKVREDQIGVHQHGGVSGRGIVRAVVHEGDLHREDHAEAEQGRPLSPLRSQGDTSHRGPGADRERSARHAAEGGPKRRERGQSELEGYLVASAHQVDAEHGERRLPADRFELSSLAHVILMRLDIFCRTV